MKIEEAQKEIVQRRKNLQELLEVKEKLIARETKDRAFFETYDALVMAEYEQLLHIKQLEKFIKEKTNEE